MKGKGWFGNSAGHKKAGKKGGIKTALNHDSKFFKKIGRKGGKVSGGNFANNPLRAKEAGKRGGKKRKIVVNPPNFS